MKGHTFFFKVTLWCSVFSSRKQALCVYCRPLQQPRLEDIASVQSKLSSSRWWSYRVISPTQRLLGWEMWEVCGCQTRACRDDSVRHLRVRSLPCRNPLSSFAVCADFLLLILNSCWFYCLQQRSCAWCVLCIGLSHGSHVHIFSRLLCYLIHFAKPC